MTYTDHAKKGEALGPEREKLYSLLDRHPGFVFLRTSDYSIRSVNKTFIELFGKPRGKPCYQIVHGREKPCDECLAHKVFDTAQPQLGEWQKPDGHVFQIYDYPFTDTDGTFMVVVVGIDITDRKRVELALQESERRFRSTVENIQLIAVQLDTEGRITFANDFLLELAGWNLEEVEGKSWFDLFLPEENREEIKKIFVEIKAIGGRTQPHYENLIITRTGELRHVAWSNTALYDLDGNLIGTSGIGEDITERKRIEKALRESEERYRDLVETAQDFIWKADNKGRFTYLNPAWETILGYEQEEMLGHHFSEFKTPEQAEKDLEVFKSTLAGQDTFGYETKYVSKTGKLVYLNFNARVLKDTDGNAIGTQGTAHNITERKLAEEELLKAKITAEEATKLKDKFVSLVAHDLKSPLGTLVNILELIQINNKVDLSSRIGRAFNMATDNAKNMINLVDNILDMGRFKSGQIKLNPEFIDGFYSSAKPIIIFREMAKEKGIELINEVKPGTRLYADPILFEEVIKNLLSNAIKFCGKGDRVTVYTPEGNKTAIAVKDTGSGIPKDILPDIFKEEVKTSTFGTAGETGTGLGLPYSRDIMKAHGGELSVESEKGKGALLTASLPNVKPEILVIDYQKTNMYIISEMLGALDVELIKAFSGEEALSILKETRPHLIICDLDMPIMDGFAFVQHIKSDPSLDSIPIIMLTFNSSAATRDKLLKAGADDYIKKNRMHHKLIRSVKKHVV